MVEACGIAPPPAAPVGHAVHPVQAAPRHGIGPVHHAAHHHHTAVLHAAAHQPAASACVVAPERLAAMHGTASAAKGSVATALASVSGQTAPRLAALAALGGGVVAVAGNPEGLPVVDWIGSLQRFAHASGKPAVAGLADARLPDNVNPVAPFGILPPGWPGDPGALNIPALPDHHSYPSAVPEPSAALTFAVAAALLMLLRLGRSGRGVPRAPDREHTGEKKFHIVMQNRANHLARCKLVR